jgi:hypothetical protein
MTNVFIVAMVEQFRGWANEIREQHGLVGSTLPKMRNGTTNPWPPALARRHPGEPQGTAAFGFAPPD